MDYPPPQLRLAVAGLVPFEADFFVMILEMLNLRDLPKFRHRIHICSAHTPLALAGSPKDSSERPAGARYRAQPLYCGAQQQRNNR